MKNISAVTRKRRSHKSSTSKEWKRTKFPSRGVLEEPVFDSSDDSFEITFTKSPAAPAVPQLSKVISLTPSKSEDDLVNISSDSDYNEAASTSDFFRELTENSFITEDSFVEICEYDRAIDQFSKGEVYDQEKAVSLSETPTKAVNVEPSKKKLNGFEKDQSFATKDVVKNCEFPRKKKVNNFENDDVQSFTTKDGIVAVLKEDQTVYFHGLCSLIVLHGKVEILGSILSKNSSNVNVYSPRGSSLLYLKNLTDSDCVPSDDVLEISDQIKLGHKSAIVLCKTLNDPNIAFIEKHISQHILPKVEPRIILQPKEGNLLKISSKWSPIIKIIKPDSKLMICGGKGVGKSTFLRFAINSLLTKYPEIRVIDLDPGQSEFTIPGCISIVRVSEPIFGVNYTHLQPTERSVLSNINIAYEPDQYIRNVRELLTENMNEIPTLINFMGYVHGIGINILSAVISYVQPTDLVQIYSEDSKRNYKFFLEKDIVRENAKLFGIEADFSYKIHKVQAMTDENDGWTAEPRQVREMCVLSFVRQMIDSDSVFTSKAPLYRISLDDVEICDLTAEKILPAAINANLVALCTFNATNRAFICIGRGIVKGIDLASNELVLMTNENLETLDKVTHLVLNGVTLPPSIYMTSDSITGHMPYVMDGHLLSLGQIPKRSRVSAKNNVENKE